MMHAKIYINASLVWRARYLTSSPHWSSQPRLFDKTWIAWKIASLLALRHLSSSDCETRCLCKLFPQSTASPKTQRIHQMRFATNSKPCTRQDWNGHKNQKVLKLESFSWHVSQQWKGILDRDSHSCDTFNIAQSVVRCWCYWNIKYSFLLPHNTYFGLWKALFPDTSRMNNLHVREFGIWNLGKLYCAIRVLLGIRNRESILQNLKMRQNTESGIRNRELWIKIEI